MQRVAAGAGARSPPPPVCQEPPLFITQCTIVATHLCSTCNLQATTSELCSIVMQDQACEAAAALPLQSDASPGWSTVFEKRGVGGVDL